MRPWYGFDFDGTLAKYNGFQGAGVLGEPIPKMVEVLKNHLKNGDEVRIVTARAWHPDITSTVTEDEYNTRMNEARAARKAIKSWCLTHIGQILAVTCEKDYGMVRLYDDRAIQVYPNTGVTLAEEITRLHRENKLLFARFAAYVGDVTCPCGKVMRFHPEPTVSDPAHFMLYSCECGVALSDFPRKDATPTT